MGDEVAKDASYMEKVKELVSDMGKQVMLELIKEEAKTGVKADPNLALFTEDKYRVKAYAYMSLRIMVVKGISIGSTVAGFVAILIEAFL